MIIKKQNLNTFHDIWRYQAGTADENSSAKWEKNIHVFFPQFFLWGKFAS